MTQMLFFLRFKAQLRRIRPELVSSLESSVAGAVENAGGKLTGERRLLAASFDENSLGFWLDMLILVETVMKTLGDASVDLYGCALVLGRDIAETSGERVCRILSSGLPGGGVWLDDSVKQGLFPYISIEKSEFLRENGPLGIYGRDKALIGGFVRVKALKGLSGLRVNHFPFQEAVVRAFKQEPLRNTVLFGPEFSGKRYGLYQFCKEYGSSPAGGVPPLIVRFTSGGLAPLVDAWSPRVREFTAGQVPAEVLKELNELGEGVFRERLRLEVSPYAVKQARRFFRLLLETYIRSVKKRGGLPVVALENIHRAGDAAVRIFLDLYAGFPGRRNLLVLGTCAGASADIEERLKTWEGVFPRAVRLNAEGFAPPDLPEMSPDLWEIAYALSLLGCYFPGASFRRLFEEEGKNPAMLSRALSILSFLGVVDIPEDPRPRIHNFIVRAEKVLGDRKEKARALARNRLLAWVGQNKLSPCFRLLEALGELGGGGDDELILKSIASDLINGTYEGIEQALARGDLEKIAGPERSESLLFIVNTLKALNHGDAGMIRSAFQDIPPDCGFSPVFRAQVLANLSGYYLGIRDVVSAGETVKEGILLSQGKNSSGLAQAYRLFSLVNLFKQRIGETIDYVGFAVDNAEKTGNTHECAVSAYYAASAHFLFGNIARALRFARQAESRAAASGNPEWADRARFFQGRLCFELGRYRDALEIFEQLRKHCAGTPEKKGLLAAWIYRARVYFQNPLTPKPSGGGPDADLFEIEASYLAGNYGRAAELSGALAGVHLEEYFVYTEQPDWRSGFAQAELLLFPRGDLWERIISVYHSLAICRLSPSGGEEALHAMQRILRDERLSEIDPWDAFYFFAWYRVLEETGAAQVDMNTAVSMAFKRLQRRASRIDDVEIRRDFLSLPRWNGALSLAAKEYKLI
ncbi:MAG: tetratricopeptide repeat protein [Treponema sp.]|jgi:tetratricopeptide (TPR) repeat protein|nr:tetratricopeptide repeat protein [Treponema sp.]